MFVRIFIIAGLAILVWSAVARSSQAHGAKQVVTVRPYDTLWSIAQRNYAGDVRTAVWRIEQAGGQIWHGGRTFEARLRFPRRRVAVPACTGVVRSGGVGRRRARQPCGQPV